MMITGLIKFVVTVTDRKQTVLKHNKLKYYHDLY